MQCPCGSSATTTVNSITKESVARDWAKVGEGDPTPPLPLEVTVSRCSDCTRASSLVIDASGKQIYPRIATEPLGQPTAENAPRLSESSSCGEQGSLF